LRAADCVTKAAMAKKSAHRKETGLFMVCIQHGWGGTANLPMNGNGEYVYAERCRKRLNVRWLYTNKTEQ
jgi:hypothetical protein